MMFPIMAFADGGNEANTNGTADVTVGKSEYSNGNCRVYFTINGAPEGGVTLNIGDEISKVLLENVGYVTPSDQFAATVHITNNTDGPLHTKKAV